MLNLSPRRCPELQPQAGCGSRPTRALIDKGEFRSLTGGITAAAIWSVGDQPYSDESRDQLFCRATFCLWRHRAGRLLPLMKVQAPGAAKLLSRRESKQQG